MSASTDGDGTKHTRAASENVLFGFIVFVALCMLILSAVVNSYFLSLMSPDRSLGQATLERIHSAQLRFLVVGVLLVGLAVLLKKTGVLRRLSERAALTNVVLMLSVFAAFLFIANNVLVTKYAAGELTTVFIRDDVLGWKLRPNADDIYNGARYIINSKGLRSPHSEYAKPAGTKRILQLGDSATVGDGLSYEGTSAHMLEAALNDNLKYGPVQVINAACDGYSPWQELAFLTSEGLKYSPDLVTVGFVLNDVTEMFTLKKYGGHGIGGQLQNSREQQGLRDFVVNRVVRRAPLYQFLRAVYLRVRLGKDPRAAATNMDRLRTEDVVFNHDKDVVKQAWEVSLGDLAGIGQVCADNGIPIVVLFIPFQFQLSLPDSVSHPQQVLRNFCEAKGMRFLDITPVFVNHMKAGGRSPDYYFCDVLHPGSEGNRLIALALQDYIEANDLLGKGD